MSTNQSYANVRQAYANLRQAYAKVRQAYANLRKSTPGDTQLYAKAGHFCVLLRRNLMLPERDALKSFMNSDFEIDKKMKDLYLCL